MYTSGDFILHGGDTGFANRQKLLFDKLSDAEQECNKSKMSIDNEDNKEPKNTVMSLKVGQKHKSETKRFRGKESIFKRPEGPAPRALSRNIPDFRRNPHKWMKYSLADVSNDNMTEQSNTKAALSFLRELKSRRLLKAKEKTDEMDVEQCEAITKEPAKMIFKNKKVKIYSKVEFIKPKRDIDEDENLKVVVHNDDKSIFRSSKIIMPEYVVGQKQKKKNKKERPLVKIDKSKQLKLDHLDEPDEDEN